MGSPEWGSDPRFATKPDRVANWDALHALMSAGAGSTTSSGSPIWRRPRTCRAFRCASRPSSSPRRSSRIAVSGATSRSPATVKAPGPPFGMTCTPKAPPPLRVETARRPNPPPLAGEGRVAVEGGRGCAAAALRHPRARFQLGHRRPDDDALSRGDGRRGHQGRGAGPRRSGPRLRTAHGARPGQARHRARPEEAARRSTIARRLAARVDVLVENFATGVMDRLGLGADALREVNPELIYVSASGLGRTGPEAHAVAYGTLLQCYAGFAGLNRHPEIPPRVGFAWLDPMCGLMLAFVTAAALWQRARSGPDGGRADRFLDDRGDAVDDGRAAARDAARRRPLTGRQSFRTPCAARRLSLRRQRRLDRHRRRRRRGVAGALRVGAGAGPACRARAGRTRRAAARDRRGACSSGRGRVGRKRPPPN